MSQEISQYRIIAHGDHGKTTLVDAMLGKADFPRQRRRCRGA